MRQYSNLLNCLQSLLGLLELDRGTQLYRDAIAICNYLTSPAYKIAVFAPFNHGKSTLLNALLGNKTLPIDLIPTTGAAISVGYGDSLETKITFQDGQEIQASGINLLKQYGILNDERRMSSEVASIRVLYDHPWLKTGVEFLDLPGTNDRQAQNDLVCNQLLSADLIIHVLDARKLMTLEERDNLNNWLYKRGINTVVFVVNFLNLLTLEEQKAVQNRLYFVAENFRSDLPQGISNLYCVDALPALRARLKGDRSAAKTSGLTSFESALQHLVSSQADNQAKFSRVRKIAQQLLEQAIAKQQEIEQIKAVEQTKQEQQAAIRRKAARLIQQSFNRVLSDFQGWLYSPKLLTNYQASLAIALQQGNFAQWLVDFQAEILNYQQAINKCINQGCEFFQHLNPQLLIIALLEPPTIQLPESILNEVVSNSPIATKIPTELNFMLKSKAGAVILGGASYVLHKVNSKSTASTAGKSSNNVLGNQGTQISSQVYADAAESYLQEFGDRTQAQLNEYEKTAQEYISFLPPAVQKINSSRDYQLQLLTNTMSNLKDELNKSTNQS